MKTSAINTSLESLINDDLAIIDDGRLGKDVITGHYLGREEMMDN